MVLHTGETLLLDYRKTIYGLPEIRLSGAEGDIVDVIAGNHRFNDEIIALEEGRRRNVSTAILRQGLEPVTWIFNSPAGFRYLMIVARKVDTNVTIRSVSVRATGRETPSDSHFSCSDSIGPFGEYADCLVCVCAGAFPVMAERLENRLSGTVVFVVPGIFG